jgi:threonylcarbamoyladenosine tRNA methylthiotransferase MtaB
MGASGGRIAPFLHVCLQSGCDATLRRMRRCYGTADFRAKVLRSRAHMPKVAIENDLIVGFPGETDEEFRQSLAFCDEMAFARMHVFRYSKRPGTPAATMEGQVDPLVMAKRADRAHQLSRQLRLAEARAAVGSQDRVVVQAPGAGITGGLFDAVLDEAVSAGSLVDVRVSGVRDDATLICTVVP